MDFFGQAKLRFTHAPSPVALRTKDGDSTDFLRICEKTTPPCQLNPLLFNGHLQTMWTAVKSRAPPIYYRRKMFEADSETYAGTFAVDFVVDPHSEADDTLPPRTAYFSEEALANIGSDDTRPMLIVLHGLSGGSHETYLRCAIEPLVTDKREWEICVINSRGCARTKLTTGTLYNARATWDTRQTVKWVRKTFPNRPLFGLGFSLGANILTNYLGEEGENCVLKAAISVGNPFNLEISSKTLQRTWLGKHVYLKVMGTSMKTMISRHKAEIIKYTNLDWDRIQAITYLHEFDREVQTRLWGYPTEDSYYRDASSSDAVLAIRIPYFAISAADDPIAVDEAVPYQEFKHNPYTVLCSTSLGGHLSWFEFGGGRWHARPICNFLQYMASEIDLESIKPTANGHAIQSQVATEFNPMRRKMVIL